MKRGKNYQDSVKSFDRMNLFDPEEAVKIAKAAGVLISYDPNYHPSLW